MENMLKQNQKAMYLIREFCLQNLPNGFVLSSVRPCVRASVRPSVRSTPPSPYKLASSGLLQKFSYQSQGGLWGLKFFEIFRIHRKPPILGIVWMAPML